jgi:hypothetical protein
MSFCKFAQDDVNLSEVGLNAAGVETLLNELVSKANVCDVRYDRQSQYCHSDDVGIAGIASAWADAQAAGFTRSGDYTSGRISFDVTTTGASETFQFPVTTGSIDAQIDWGDGNIEEFFTSNGDARLTHTFATAGTYTVTLTGRLCNLFRFSSSPADRSKVTAIHEIQGDKIQMTDATNLFFGCSNATGPFPSLAECTGFTTLRNVFHDCTSMTTPPDLTGLVDVTSGLNAFDNCSSMTSFPDLTQVPNIVNCQQMFINCSGAVGAPDLTALTSATNTNGMFSGCTSMSGTVDLSSLTSVTTASAMFQTCTSVSGYTGFENMTSLQDSSSMFRTNTSLLSVPDMSGMGSVTNVDFMFFNSDSMAGTPDLSAIGSVTSAQNAFNGCTALQGPLDLSAATSLVDGSNMFQNCTSVTGQIDTSGLTALEDGGGMFRECVGVSGTFDFSPMTSLVNAGFIVGGMENVATWNFGTCPNVTNWSDAFTSASMSASELDDWLIAVDTHNVATPGDLSYGGAGSPSAGATHLDSARSVAGQAAVTSLLGKGWTRTGTY